MPRERGEVREMPKCRGRGKGEVEAEAEMPRSGNAEMPRCPLHAESHLPIPPWRSLRGHRRRPCASRNRPHIFHLPRLLLLYLLLDNAGTLSSMAIASFRTRVVRIITLHNSNRPSSPVHLSSCPVVLRLRTTTTTTTTHRPCMTTKTPGTPTPRLFCVSLCVLLAVFL